LAPQETAAGQAAHEGLLASRTLASAGDQRIVISVAPEEIALDPAIERLRTWTGTSAQELAIPELARTMLEEGQQEPCVARTNERGDLVLVSGARRRAAVMYNRENGIKVVDDEHPEGVEMLLDVIVTEMSPHAALRRAMIENVQREDFTPIEMARNIKYIREVFGWGAKGGTTDVAAFLGVSPATVTQTEKLLELPEEIQGQVERGEIRKETALEYRAAEPAAIPEVMSKAQEKADKEAQAKEERRRKNEEARRKVVEARAGGKGGQKGAKADKTPVARLEEAVDELDKAKAAETPPPKAKGKVAGRHVRAAVKELEAAKEGRTKAPRMNELCDLMGQLNSPAAYPVVMCKLAAALEAWGHGKKSDKFLRAAWEDVVDVIPTRSQGPGLEPKARKKAGGKKVGKTGAGKKAPVAKIKVKKTAKAKGKK